MMNYNKHYKKELPSRKILIKNKNGCDIKIINKKYNFGRPFIRMFPLNWETDGNENFKEILEMFKKMQRITEHMKFYYNFYF